MIRTKTVLLIVFLLIPFFLVACSSTQLSKGSAPIIQQIAVTPEAIAVGGFVRVSVEAVDSEGGYMSIRVGRGESLPYASNKTFVCKAPDETGTAEVDVYLSNGHMDVTGKIRINVDDILPQTTLRAGSVSLPVGRSFDFLTASVKEQYYGSLDYELDGNSRVLTTKGDGKGNRYPYYTYDGGIVNLTYYKGDSSLSQVFDVYNGYYSASIDSDPYYEEQLLAEGNVYAFFIIKNEGNYYGKLKVISMDSEKIVFDWVFQTAVGKKKFYD